MLLLRGELLVYERLAVLILCLNLLSALLDAKKIDDKLSENLIARSISFSLVIFTICLFPIKANPQVQRQVLKNLPPFFLTRLLYQRSYLNKHFVSQ